MSFCSTILRQVCTPFGPCDWFSRLADRTRDCRLVNAAACACTPPPRTPGRTLTASRRRCRRRPSQSSGRGPRPARRR
eukprot:1490556-Pyramimonas_sp.AAC.1